MPLDEYLAALDVVPGLRDLATKHLDLSSADSHSVGVAMEFVLEGLHHHSKVAKDDLGATSAYRDMVGSIFAGGEEEDEDYFG